MSTLSTVIDPAAAVVVSGIAAWVAKHLGELHFGKATVESDISKAWPDVKAAAEAAKPLVDDVPAVREVAETASKDAATALAAANKATDGIATEVASEVQKQFGTLLSQLAANKPAT